MKSTCFVALITNKQADCLLLLDLMTPLFVHYILHQQQLCIEAVGFL